MGEDVRTTIKRVYYSSVKGTPGSHIKKDELFPPSDLRNQYFYTTNRCPSLTTRSDHVKVYFRKVDLKS